MTLPSGDAAQLSTELRTVITRLTKKLRSHAPTREKLSLTERAVIRLLDEHQELLPSELAKREKVTTQSMSQILNHLSELDYIVRRPLETDKRKVSIALSETGRNFLYTARHEKDEWLHKAIEQSCSAGEQAILRQALGPLTKLLDVD